jgi:hypothetical protein
MFGCSTTQVEILQMICTKISLALRNGENSWLGHQQSLRSHDPMRRRAILDWRTVEEIDCTSPLLRMVKEGATLQRWPPLLYWHSARTPQENESLQLKLTLVVWFPKGTKNRHLKRPFLCAQARFQCQESMRSWCGFFTLHLLGYPLPFRNLWQSLFSAMWIPRYAEVRWGTLRVEIDRWWKKLTPAILEL